MDIFKEASAMTSRIALFHHCIIDVFQYRLRNEMK
jgi:hypothetical protein